MGHRFSKTAANNIAARTISTNESPLNTTTSTNVIHIPIASQQKYIGSKINLQIQGSPNNCRSSRSQDTKDSCINNPTIAAGILQQQNQSQLQQEQQQQQHPYNINNSISSSLTSVNNLSCGRQIIIKIQLAKMENGNETSSSSLSKEQQQQLQQDTSFESLPADCNLNSTELSTTVTATATKFLNLTLNSNSNFKAMPNPNITTTTATNLETETTSSSASLFRTAGSSLKQNNNYLNSNIGITSDTSSNSILSTSRINERPERLNSLEFNDEIVEQNIGEIVEYCEVLECNNPKPQTSSNSCNNSMQMLSINEVIETDNEINVCCRRKSKTLATNGGSSMSSSSNVGTKSKSRCRKCSCRDAFRRFLDPSLSRSSNKVGKQQKEQKHNKSQDRHSINNPILKNTNKQQQHRNSMHSTTVSTSTTRPITVATTAAIVVPPAITNPVSLWSSTTNDGNDVIIPITTPAPSQFVVVQCAIVNPSNAALHSLSTSNTTSNISSSTKNVMSVPAQDISSPTSTSTSSNDFMVKVPLNSNNSATPSAGTTGPIVHSQVDFVHYLVPDLERITNSSFYWGKMDRYEAERLLEGKPEGTFLLRDSAQEEFLFSVTFRKYGRSLHARIEQSDHRFSFDCHDPCVFTASTVTGLLEHYKDPACVMFFEPMLTIPLHRKNCFSLQKLCRATIVSNTTYDGINELELPARMKSYLKEYHYKQKLRVKSNEPTYTLQCK